MSLAAFIWASNLPLDIVSGTAFRALLKYADRVDEHGHAAWFTADGLAESLGCSRRTAQRVVRELLDSGLMIEGDQRYTQHIRGGNRPTVYDLNMRPAIAQRLDLGDTTPSVTSQQSGYDRSVHRDTTTVGAHRTVIEPNKDIHNVSTEGYDKADVSRSRPPFGVQPAPVIPRYVPEPPKPRPAPRTTAEAEAVSDLEALPCPAMPGWHHWLPLGADECVRGCGESLTVERNPS